MVKNHSELGSVFDEMESLRMTAAEWLTDLNALPSTVLVDNISSAFSKLMVDLEGFCHQAYPQQSFCQQRSSPQSHTRSGSAQKPSRGPSKLLAWHRTLADAKSMWKTSLRKMQHKLAAHKHTRKLVKVEAKRHFTQVPTALESGQAPILNRLKLCTGSKESTLNAEEGPSTEEVQKALAVLSKANLMTPKSKEFLFEQIGRSKRSNDVLTPPKPVCRLVEEVDFGTPSAPPEQELENVLDDQNLSRIEERDLAQSSGEVSDWKVLMKEVESGLASVEPLKGRYHFTGISSTKGTSGWRPKLSIRTTGSDGFQRVITPKLASQGMN